MGSSLKLKSSRRTEKTNYFFPLTFFDSFDNPSDTETSRRCKLDLKLCNMGVAPILALTILLVSTAIALPGKPENQKPLRMDASTIRKMFKGIGKTFALSEGSLANYDAARTFCRDQGGDLATMPSYKEFDLVMSQINDEDLKNNYIRIGAKRSGEDTSNSGKKTDFHWVTGEPIPVSFAKWCNWEPDNQMTAALHIRDSGCSGGGIATVDLNAGPLRVLCEI